MPETADSDAVFYNRSPTMELFHADNSLVRGLRGPVGCYSGDTEFLTPKGWVRFDKYVGYEEVAQWDEITKKISFVKPTDHIKEPCDEFIHFHNYHSLSMVLSYEHRMPLYNYRGEFKVEDADEIATTPSRYTVPTTFRIPHKDLPISDFKLRLMVAVHADGSLHKWGTKCTICVRKQRKKDRLAVLLEGSGTEHTTGGCSVNRPTEKKFYFEPPVWSRKFTEWCWGLSERQLEIVIDEIQYWDGLYEGDDYRFYSIHKEEADFIQYAVHAIGGRASIGVEIHDNPKWKDGYIVHIALPSSYKSKVMLRGDTCSIDYIPSQDGFKYCFTVPTGFMVVRHNDRVFISGNSGKTSACCVEIFQRAVRQKPFRGVRSSRWALIRNTHPQLLDTTLKTWMEWFEAYTKITMSAPIKGKMITDLPDGTKLNLELLFIALDVPKDIRKFKGMEVTGCFINEAVEISKDVLDKAIERQNRYPSKRRGGASWSGVIMDTNSCSDRHWWYKYAEVVRPQNWKFYSQPSALLKFDKQLELDKFYTENPDYPQEWRKMATLDMKDSIYIPGPKAENVENLNSGYQYWLDMVPGKDEIYISVNVLNDYGAIVDGMPVYPEYQDAKHCAKENLKPIPNIGIVLGFDFGLMPACSFSQQAPTGQKRVIDELCVEEHGAMGIRQFSRTVVVPYLIENYLDYILKGLFQGWGGREGEFRVETDEQTAFIVLNERLYPNLTPEQAIKVYLSGKEISLGDLGIEVKPARTNKFGTRRDAVSRLLLMKLDDKPGLVISPKCVTLRDGMRGHYCYPRMQVAGDAIYHQSPVKGPTSHINDGLQADCLMSTPFSYNEAEVAEEREKAKQREGLDVLSLRAQEGIEREREEWREEEEGNCEETEVTWW